MVEPLDCIVVPPFVSTTVSANIAPAEEDIWPADLTVPEINTPVPLAGAFANMAVPPITIGPDEDIVPLVTVSAPWLTSDPVSVVPA